MKNALIIPKQKLQEIEKLIAQGDISPMTPVQRLGYMRSMCKLLGISMLGQPFDFIKFDGKVQMFANAKCAAQLRAVYKISIKIISCERIDGLYVTNVEAVTGKGRSDADIGAINIKGLSGKALENAMMKGVTKAKRRVTLSLCGLGMLDSDTAKELAEQEAKIVTELAVEETGNTLDGTTGRPEFETERPVQSIEPGAPHNTSPTQYTLKSVKGFKGKSLDRVPLKKLVDWLKFYDKTAEKGDPLHADIQDDAFYIRAFLDEHDNAPKPQETAP